MRMATKENPSSPPPMDTANFQLCMNNFLWGEKWAVTPLHLVNERETTLMQLLRRGTSALPGSGGLPGLTCMGPTGLQPTNRERILQQLPPPSQQTQRQQTHRLVFLWKRPLSLSSELPGFRVSPHLTVNLCWDLGRWGLSWSSPSAALQSISVSLRGALTRVWCSISHVWCLFMTSAFQGIPLDHPALVTQGSYLPGSHETVNNHRNNSWQATIPRALHRQQTETPSILTVKEAYLLVPQLWPLGKAWGLAHLCLQNCFQGTWTGRCYLCTLSPP